MAGVPEVAFVTIGQSPRPDMVPEMLAWIRRDVPALEALEVGALDGLGRQEVAALAPAGDEHRLVSRLADGTEVVVSKPRVQERLKAIMADLDERAPTLVVLLCTGHFEGVRSRTLMVESQRVVDHAADALAEDGRTVGLLLPLAEQMGEFHVRSTPTRRVLMAWASPYSGDRFAAAARELAGADFIVMDCMGYDEAMRRRVAEASGRPVLLARRLVADAVARLL